MAELEVGPSQGEITAERFWHIQKRSITKVGR